jgi:VanZ family protein
VQKLKILLKKLLLYWSPVFLWCLAIFLVSNRTVPKSSEFFWQDFVIKKLAHVFEYAVLSTFIYRALINSGVGKRNAGIWAVVLTVLYGASDEFHQSFTPGRQARIRDVLIDGFGGGLAVYLIWKFLPKVPKRLKYIINILKLNAD